MAALESILDSIAGVIWGPFVLIPLLLGTGMSGACTDQRTWLRIEPRTHPPF